MKTDAKTDQMITLVLQVNGYARADDLQSLAPQARAAALHTYYQNHGTGGLLHWRGDQLWAGAAPATFSQPAPTADPKGFNGVDSFGELARGAQPYVPPTAVATLDRPVASDPSGLTGLDLESFDAVPQPFSAPVDAALEPGFMPVPQSGPTFVMPDNTAVSPLWWALAILLAPLGGIIAYFAVRGTNPLGAAKVLKASILVWVALAAISILVILAAVLTAVA